MSEQDVKPVKAGQLKAGHYIIYNNEVYLIRDIEKSKAGKHGHAKARIKVENVFTGSKTELTVPTDTKLKSPIIDKRTAQVISLTGDSAQLMDMETYETFEAALPDDEELASKLQAGAEVEYWALIGKKKIMRVKG
ncbi:MAG: translation initiation factor IF-5A [Candidatus Heimdallarchaeaceae archaeon]